MNPTATNKKSHLDHSVSLYILFLKNHGFGGLFTPINLTM